jgi:hypothetical protein
MEIFFGFRIRDKHPGSATLRYTTGAGCVADPVCLSQIIPDPDFYQYRIPDLGSWIQKQQRKNLFRMLGCRVHPVLRIHEILVRIWILGSVLVTNWSWCRSESCYFQRHQTEIIFCFKFFTYLFLKVHFNVADPNPDPHVFGPPGSGSPSQRYGSRSGSGSGSFYHHAKIVRKPLIPLVPTILWLFLTFYLWKIM